MSESRRARLSRVRPRVRRVSWALLDQALSSTGNLLSVLLILRSGDASSFGAFSVALVLQGLALGLGRSMIGDVLVLRLRRLPRDEPHAVEHATTLALLVSLGCSLVMLGAAAFVPDTVGQFLIAMAIISPVIALQDIQRYVAFARGKPQVAAALDGTWLAVQLVATVPVLLFAPFPLWLMGCWGLGAAVSVAHGWRRGGCHFRFVGLRQFMVAERNRATSFVADYTLSTGTGQLGLLALSGILSLASFGLFRLALTIVSALTNVLSALRSLILASFSTRRPIESVRIVILSTIASSSVVFGFVILLLLLPQPVGETLFGPAWDAVGPILILAGISETLRVAAFPVSDFVKAYATGRRLVVVRGAVGTAIVIGLVVGALINGVHGVLTGLVGAQALALVLWLTIMWVTLRSSI